MSKGNKENKKAKREEKRKKKEKEKRKKKREEILKKFFLLVIGAILVKTIIVETVIPEIIANIIPHHLPPMYTDIEIKEWTTVDACGKLDEYSKDCNIFFEDSIPKVKIYLDNNNSDFVRITDIYVNVIKYTHITEEDIIYGNGSNGGDMETPIYLRTNIEPHIGAMKVEIDQEPNLKYREVLDTESGNYIEIANSTSDEFILLMNTDKQGYYSIEVEFQYKYHGKAYTIKTETTDYIFIEKDFDDSLSALWYEDRFDP